MIWKFQAELPAVDRKEVLRYMGCREPDSATEELLTQVLSECTQTFAEAAVCYTVLPITWERGSLLLNGETTGSRDLEKALSGCRNAVLFAATVGIGIDRLIARNSRLSPARALCLQALGAERVEALCDAFCAEYGERLQPLGQRLRPRFSAGYGDLPLQVQKDWIRILDCGRQIGIFLNESLTMSPSKSVTAVAGVEQGNETNPSVFRERCAEGRSV